MFTLFVFCGCTLQDPAVALVDVSYVQALLR